jgi:putative transposase
MKGSRFARSKPAGFAREAGAKALDIRRRHGIGRDFLQNGKRNTTGWRSRKARLKSLEDENQRLKKLLAEAMLDNAALKDGLGKKGHKFSRVYPSAELATARAGASDRHPLAK